MPLNQTNKIRRDLTGLFIFRDFKTFILKEVIFQISSHLLSVLFVCVGIYGYQFFEILSKSGY